MLQAYRHRWFVRLSASCIAAAVLCSVTTADCYAAHARLVHARQGRPAAGAGHKSRGPASLNRCVAAYRESRENERTSHLRAARDLLIECAKPSCSRVLRQQCINRYIRLDADMPSVVPVVTDRSGAPRVDVEVKVDGAPLASRLDGRAIAVDPGVHEFSFHAGGELLASQKVMIIEGQRNRPIAVSVQAKRSLTATKAPGTSDSKMRTEQALAPAAASPVTDLGESAPGAGTAQTSGAPAATGPVAEEAPDAANDSEEAPSDLHESKVLSKPHRSVLPYVLASVGVAGIGGFGLLTYWGRQDNAALDRCTPNCQQSSVDHIHNLYLAADISLGVGIAALGTAAVLWATSSRGNPNAEPASSQKTAAYRLDFRPTNSGAFAALSGAF